MSKNEFDTQLDKAIEQAIIKLFKAKPKPQIHFFKPNRCKI